MTSILDYLEHWAAVQPDKRFISFLDLDGQEREAYTYLDFHERTLHLSWHLLRQAGLRRGDRVLLVYPPGLEIIAAFIACVRAGVIPVPVYPPTPVAFEMGLTKLNFVALDCQAAAALTSTRFLQSYRLQLGQRRSSSAGRHPPAAPKLDWISTDDVRGTGAEDGRNDSTAILFLQYTSGSTSDPKGVIVSHENVIHNATVALNHAPIGVSWLPQYHDMGLIGNYLFPLIKGGTTFGLSPLDFLKRPVLWLQTISRVRATAASSPNFGFEYCLREDKVPAAQLAGLDLSSLRVLMNAAEPVCVRTQLRFLDRFAPYGLRPQALVVAYGLAENTLAATHYGRRVLTLNKRLLQQGTLAIERRKLPEGNQVRLMSCGQPLEGIRVRIVHPNSGAALSDQQIGEVWLTGKSACQGYWKRPALTREIFGNALAGDSDESHTYLRTGDLGFFHEGELFVCGRIKDLIILRGVNYYPQDIEKIVESVSSKIRPRGVAAFHGGGEQESLIVLAELKRLNDLPEADEIARAIRTFCYAEPQAIVFVPPRTIVRTTSGKIARGLTRRRYLAGELAVLATHLRAGEQASAKVLPGPMERFHHLLDRYDLKGDEDCTFAEVGIDSLALVTLMEEVERLSKECGVSDLAKEVDAQFIQQLTVAEFFSLVNQFPGAAAGARADARMALQQRKREQVGQEGSRMRSDARLEAIQNATPAAGADALTDVFLTGPTGFFGAFLLRSLLERTPFTYHVLTRAGDPRRGMERIRCSLRQARIWTPALDQELERRVHVVCGDISQPNLGLRAKQWESLSLRTQAVMHNAAAVNYVLNYEALRPHNVEGTRELLRFARAGQRKEFHLVSSTVIFGWTAEGTLLETDHNEDMKNLDFGYAQTKWVAEQLVFAAEKQGLKVRVYRPAFLSASAEGAGSRSDIIILLLAFMINHGIAVRALNQISLLPAEIAANNMAAIFNLRQVANRTLNVTVDGYYNMMDITHLITSEHGCPFVYFDLPDFVAEIKRRCAKSDPLYPLVHFIESSHLKIAAMEHKRYGNECYREARRRCGNGCGDPPLKDTVANLMAYMLREGIISPPSGAPLMEPEACPVSPESMGKAIGDVESEVSKKTCQGHSEIL